VSRPKPGLAFSLVCDLGFAVGLVTHDVPKIGSLVWVAEPTFDEEPTLDRVRQIHSGRWPVFFPLSSAIRRQLVTPIGQIDLPAALKSFPVMRSGNRDAGWTAFTEVDGVRRRLGTTNDPTLAIYPVVNDTTLKEMVVSGWRPEMTW
jgi:hypothetical protein